MDSTTTIWIVTILVFLVVALGLALSAVIDPIPDGKNISANGLNMNDNLIINVGTAQSDGDAANKLYVDTAVAALRQRLEEIEARYDQ
ncbi:MAG: hypothetical protein CMK92_00785 [Pseudomonas sp.]|nr:hypothetical protein [Pseudomonas sp.]